MFDTIVAGLDSSPNAELAIAWAADEAHHRHATLRIVACAEVPMLGRSGGMTLEEIDASDAATKRHLERVAGELAVADPHLKIDTETICRPPRHVLIEESDRADLVVVGSVGDRRTRNPIRGRTARALCRHGHSPVAVVPTGASVHRPRRLLVGVDGSPSSNDAVRWAAARSCTIDAEIVLVHCRAFDRVDDESLAFATVAAAMRLAADHSIGRVTTRVLHRDPAWALLDIARADDVIVIGRSSKHALARAVLGSTTSTLLDEAHVAFVVV